MIRVVAFDLDDTLWPVRPALLRAESVLGEFISERHGIRYDHATVAPLRERLLATQPQLAGRVSEFRRSMLTALFAQAGLDATQARHAAEEAFAVFLRARSEVELFDDVMETLEQLAREFVLGALTNGNADIGQIGLDRLFAFSFNAEQAGRPKPAPDLFHAALRSAGAQPGEMVYVGDDPVNDVAAAQAAGLRAVWIRRDKTATPPSPPVAADATIDSLRDLPEVLAAWSRD